MYKSKFTYIFFFSFAADSTFFSEMFPGINIRAATLEANFYVPFWRELLLRLGVISVSERSIRNVLKMGPGNAGFYQLINYYFDLFIDVFINLFISLYYGK